jgi:hypothetical protein
LAFLTLFSVAHRGCVLEVRFPKVENTSEIHRSILPRLRMHGAIFHPPLLNFHDVILKQVKNKGKGDPVTGPGGPIGCVEVQFNSLLTSALEEVCGQHHAPAAFTPGKDPVHSVQET